MCQDSSTDHFSIQPGETRMRRAFKRISESKPAFVKALTAVYTRAGQGPTTDIPYNRRGAQRRRDEAGPRGGDRFASRSLHGLGSAFVSTAYVLLSDSDEGQSGRRSTRPQKDT